MNAFLFFSDWDQLNGYKRGYTHTHTNKNEKPVLESIIGDRDFLNWSIGTRL